MTFKQYILISIVVIALVFVSGCIKVSNGYILEYNVESCDEGLKAEPINFEGKGNSIAWDQVLHSYCQSKKQIKLELHTEKNYLIIKEVFDPKGGAVAMCSCPMRVHGAISNLNDGEYHLVLYFVNKYVNQEQFIGQYSFTVQKDSTENIKFKEESPDILVNGYAESAKISDYDAELSYNEEENKIAFFLNAENNAKEPHRISIGFYDWNKDQHADWIRLTDYYSKDKTDSISFYRGDAELKHMLKEYGSHLEGLKNIKISENEIGVTEYTGGQNGLFFKPISDERISFFFELGDKMLSSKSTSPKLVDKFKVELESAVSIRITDLPSDWKHIENA